MAEIIAGGKQVGESSECVALVKHPAPEVGAAKFWQEDLPIHDFGSPKLERGTPIATFIDGRSPNRSTGNHAAIFLEYGTKGGRQGFWGLDQSKGDPPRKAFRPPPVKPGTGGPTGTRFLRIWCTSRP